MPSIFIFYTPFCSICGVILRSNLWRKLFINKMSSLRLVKVSTL